jgi:hypothetical protein
LSRYALRLPQADFHKTPVRTARSGHNLLDEYVLVIKEKGIMAPVWLPERVHLYTVRYDHSWNVWVSIKVA